MRNSDDETEFASVALTTRRLLLRPPREGDGTAIAALSANPSIAHNLSALPGQRRGDGGATFVAIERRGGAIVGVTGFGAMPERPGANEVATWIGEPYWGGGLATEATQAVIDHYFADRKAVVLWCSNRVSNSRARRVIEKCGFQFRETGMVRSPVFQAAMPVERFILERRNWASLKSWGADAGEETDEPRHDAA
jgi:RimJ/RimL family protein N-acetyltransferase